MKTCLYSPKLGILYALVSIASPSPLYVAVKAVKLKFKYFNYPVTFY